MKLEKIEIKNYRSLFHDYEAKESFVLDLGDGMNAIAGPNNSGKSNIFRALALALDGDTKFDRTRDQPAPWKGTKPSILLTFRIPKSARGPEQTLLRYLKEYEEEVNDGKRTFAAQGLVKLRVTIEGTGDSPGSRREVFVASGVGARSLPSSSDLLTRALDQFHKCFHFVSISSGESLESLMEGKFRDILRNVLRENLSQAFESAERSRETYCTDLQTGLLEPLTSRIGEELKDLFPEIRGVTLSPEVLSLDETLSKMRVSVSDIAVTDLAEKGTGVRGGLIIAMLRHFVETGRRSMLFAVEEPESFLHPGAQEQLREDLEALADRADVSLLVTTHSPYIVSRRSDARVFSIEKEVGGATRLKGSASGDAPHAGLLGGLFRDRLYLEWLDRAQATTDDALLILVVEGFTDHAFAALALERAGRLDLLDGITFLEAGAGQATGGGGASAAILQALVTRSLHPADTVVAVLLDNDAPGVAAQKTLREIGERSKHWKAGKTLFSYANVFHASNKHHPWEAEDLWPDHLHESFLALDPDTDWYKGKSRCPTPDSGWRYDWAAPAKGELYRHLSTEVTEADTARWVQLFEHIRKGTGIDRLPKAEKPPSAETPTVPSPGIGGARPATRATAKGKATKVAFLSEIRDIVADPLEAAGFKTVSMHPNGSYIVSRFPDDCGLRVADGHLSIKVRSDDASCSLILGGLRSRPENAAALAVLHDRFRSRLDTELPVPIDAWTAGIGEAVRSYAQSVLPGGGYVDGTAATTAAWAQDLGIAWLKLLRSDPITDLADAVARRTAPGGTHG